MESSHQPGVVTGEPSWLHRLLRITPGKMPDWVLHRGACDDPDAVVFCEAIAILSLMFGIGFIADRFFEKISEPVQWLIVAVFLISGFVVFWMTESLLVEKARRCERVARRRVPLGPSKNQTPPGGLTS